MAACDMGPHRGGLAIPCCSLQNTGAQFIPLLSECEADRPQAYTAERQLAWTHVIPSFPSSLDGGGSGTPL